LNLPEPKGGRWGQGLTAANMKECVWPKPALVGEFEFLEWTGDDHLRDSKFIALSEMIDRADQWRAAMIEKGWT
jgi:ATP-dependent DNA ligase